MKYFITATFLMLYCIVSAQENDLASFQKNNSEFHFMSEENFNLLPESLKFRLVSQILTFQDSIQEIELPQLSTKNLTDLIEDDFVKNQDQFVKEWVSQNPQIKLVPQSQFQEGNSLMQQEYIDQECLIMNGEYVVYEDVINYINQH